MHLNLQGIYFKEEGSAGLIRRVSARAFFDRLMELAKELVSSLSVICPFSFFKRRLYLHPQGERTLSDPATTWRALDWFS